MQTSRNAFLWNADYVNLNLTKTGEGIQDHPAVCGAPLIQNSDFNETYVNVIPVK